MNLRILSLLTLFAVLLPAAAMAQPGNGRFEIYGGIYRPEGLDDELTYGLRAGYKLSDHFGIDGTAGTFTVKEDPVEVDVILVDLSLKAYLSSGDKAQFFLFAGPGWAFLDASAFGIDVLSEDSLTAHAGVGLDLWLSDRLYLRPDVRGRWFEQADSNDLDWEASLALGFSF